MWRITFEQILTSDQRIRDTLSFNKHQERFKYVEVQDPVAKIGRGIRRNGMAQNAGTNRGRGYIQGGATGWGGVLQDTVEGFN